MADTQDDPEDELTWDLRALRAADSFDGADVRSGTGPPASVRGFYPSLHLNLAADYHRLGEHQLARGHLGRARAAAGALSDDDYGDGVRAAIARMDQRLPGAGGGADQSP